MNNHISIAPPITHNQGNRGKIFYTIAIAYLLIVMALPSIFSFDEQIVPVFTIALVLGFISLLSFKYVSSRISIIPFIVYKLVILYIFIALYIVFIRFVSETPLSLGSMSYWGNKMLYYIYMPLFLLIFAYKYNYTLVSTRTYIILVAILYTYYNIQYYLENNKIPHSAYIGCFGLILFSYFLYLVLYTKHNIIIFLLLSAAVVAIFTVTILSVLRGASFTALLILTYQITMSRMHSNTRLFTLLFIAIIALIILQSNAIRILFAEGNTYGYTNPSDMINAITGEDANRDVRINWAAQVIDVVSKSPVFGTMYAFSFYPFPNHLAGSTMLHNYFASMVVDGGIALSLPYMLIIIISLRKAHFGIKHGNSINIVFVSWIIAILSTYGTNAVGHVINTSCIMGFMLAYALFSIYRSREVFNSCIIA